VVVGVKERSNVREKICPACVTASRSAGERVTKVENGGYRVRRGGVLETAKVW